ncbi:oxidoreductase [Fictibacillus barbaricus]|uniref:NAD(P)-dependent dehydrogenase (Short-subunit alcohol dehydrogenase family) n=1 Tax=Fictibacillus barbaricus TaxID=182136 RepID=A0ABU1TWK9_9BACL|nr:oxidoreductase [Fictibacillus barbaricus]MDR7071595.1 NAD(P)-dependent dehydrogenase (short-subunit alcohol dehydrogenase family) [Fictibacillus barbaricus]
MNKKIAIVTGCSSGFGMLTAVELAKKGFEVISTLRNMNKSESLLTLADEQNVADSIRLQPLDVTSSDSINEFKKFLLRLDHVDVLVNNAGFAAGGFCEELSVDDYRAQFETNVFGLIAVTQAVLPVMRKKQCGRIINISSISGRFGFPGMSPYTASKHALEGFSESLRLEVKPSGIDVVLVEPGSYQTNIWSTLDNITLNPESPYHSYMEAILNNIGNVKVVHGNPLDVAELVTRIATMKKTPKLRYPIGNGVKMNIFMKTILPWKVLENMIMKKLLKK